MSSEMGLTSIFVLLFCWSSVAIGNTAPDIIETIYSTCEDTPKGDEAFRILATDPEGDPLTYSLGGSNATFFTVESSTGIVKVARELDRETDKFLDGLVATVSDSVNTVKKSIIVTIDDTNDNRPIFEEATYDENIPENTLVGSTLFKVKATDADEVPVTYSISESVPSSGLDVFKVDKFGNVILKDKLNYTSISTFYRLKINAMDSGKKCHENVPFTHSTPVFAFITVVDVPDLDPRFIGIPYSGIVEENTATGHTVLTVTAVDQDTGINDYIIYSIQVSSGSELFAINENGVITVNGNIDRETIGDNVQLIVKATERGENILGVQASATTAVSISITDVNDNSPVFYKCEEDECVTANSFSGQVPEHSLGAVTIHMTVKDADKNSQTELLLDGLYKDVFSVEPPVVFSERTVQLIVKSPKDLDYEKTQEMTLTVIAVDRGDSARRTTAAVTITILDTNDHSPIFPEDLYSAQVPEHCSDGTPVITITARDPDTMDQGKLTYRLQPENILPYFDVNTTTGLIFVKNGTLLDRESRALYSVTLQAQDSEGKPGNTVIDISVTDINDKTPVPNRNTYQEFVMEGQELSVRVEATDGDEPNTPNSQLLFSIVPGPLSENFAIDPDSGVLINKEPLDREAITPALNGKIELNVNISDRGLPPLSTLVQVIINVQDINDNKPIFGNSSYTFSVKEGQKGAFVGAVDAKDNDQTTEFNRISFSIINGAFGSYTIRSALDAPRYIGNINVDPDIELDYESTQKIFKLEVEAADFAQEKANIIVTVHVLDVNDERPAFKPTAPVSVQENSKETAPIGRFTAVDVDSNHSLVYELLSVKCICDGEEMPCDWFDVEKSGSVIVNPNATIDYELCDQATVEAGVMDEYTEKGEAESEEPGKMVINILDMNDNAPEFLNSNSLFVLVSESASMGTSVAGISATDKDSGKNGQIQFKVSKVEYKNLNGDISKKDNLFEATTTLQNEIYVGIITSTAQQDTTIQGSYLVTVEAKDTGGLTNTTVLEIFIISGSFKFVLYFEAELADINAQKSEIVRDLTAIVQAAVHVVTVKEGSPEPERAELITMMDAYAIYENGTAVITDNVHRLLSFPENFLRMRKYGLIYVGTEEPEEKKQDPLMFALYGMVAGLMIVTAVLTLSFVCTRRNFKRKLRAANAMKSASAVSENQRGPVVPGTNQYTMEGANPVLNLNIDSSIALDLNEDSDVDKLSLNSLDNSNDSAVYEKDTKPIMKKIHEEEDEEQGPPMYIEPLGAALAQRGQKISNNPLLGDDNPIFNTTDL